MEHRWFEDDSFEPSENSDYYKKELCVNCEAEKIHWMRIRNNKLEKHWFIMEGCTQYGYNHKCSGSLLPKTLF